MSEVKQIDRTIKNELEGFDQALDKTSTKDFAEKLSARGLGGEYYIKQRLHVHREWFPNQVEGLETFKEDDDTGGEDTRYWRLRE